MRRIILLLAVAALMGALAVPAFAAPNPDSAAGRCGPPGQIISDLAKWPNSNPPDLIEAFIGYKSPGEGVITQCAPGQQP